MKDGSLIRTLKAHRGGVYGLVVSPAGDRLYSCGSDNTIQVHSQYLHAALLSEGAMGQFSQACGWSRSPILPRFCVWPNVSSDGTMSDCWCMVVTVYSVRAFFTL